MDSSVKKNARVLCRVCLTSSTNLIHLATPVKEKVLFFKEHWSIHRMLELVTFSKIILDDQLFPSNICHMCFSFLKITYEFQTQFNTSQHHLEKVLKEKPIKKEDPPITTIVKLEQEKPTAPVELIYGDNTFDLKDVLVVEEKQEDRFSYEGFLKNLGTEVTAEFVGSNNCSFKFVQHDNNNCEIIKMENEVVEQEPQSKRKRGSTTQNKKGSQISPRNIYNGLDISKMKLTKYPDECKIVIEEVLPHKTTIVRTLYECPRPTCAKIFTKQSELFHHRDIKHPAPDPLICEKCGHVAYTQSQLYHHMQKHRGKVFPCNQCDKKYDTISRLRSHLQIHQNARNFLCNVCGRNFNYAVSLKYHLRLHADKKFVCNICGLKYRMPNTLKRHILTHTKDRPYSCDYCEKRFPSRGEKNDHEMRHTGVRPYHCQYCGKGYIKSYNLKLHYLSHPGPNECDYCSKTFIDIKYLNMHMKRLHKIDTE